MNMNAVIPGQQKYIQYKSWIKYVFPMLLMNKKGKSLDLHQGNNLPVSCPTANTVLGTWQKPFIQQDKPRGITLTDNAVLSTEYGQSLAWWQG